MPTPQRLPIVNSDDGVWGDILRQYLMKEHFNDDTDNAVNGGHQKITIRAGTTGAGTAPIKLTSGSLMTTPEAGAIEFLSDKLYFTQSTGPTRKTLAAYDDTSGATGDVYYRDSGGHFVRLGIGSNGNVLTVSSGLPSWQAPTGGTTFSDTVYTLQDATDATKQAKFDVPSGQTASTTRTHTLPAVDSTLASLAGTETLTNKTIDVDNNTVTNLEVDNFKGSAIVTEAEGLNSSDNDTSIPTTAAVKDYIDDIGLMGGTYYSANIGDGSSTTIDVNHNLGTRDLVVNIYDTSTYETVNADKSMATLNKVTLTFQTAPALNAYRVVVVGAASPVGPGGGDAYTNTSSSVTNEVALFADNGGKTLKRATGNGLATLTSGVLSTTTLVTESATIASNDNDTSVPTSAAVKDYVDATTGDGDASTNTASSVDNEVALFSGTGGKTLKRASTTGIAKLASGVLSTVTAPSGDIVGTTDTQTLSAKTLTDPRINAIKDTNGANALEISATASAVNNLRIVNAAAGSGPYFEGRGADTDVGVNFVPKGAGRFGIYVSTGQTPTIQALGADTNHNLNLVPKGTGRVTVTGVNVPTISSVDNLTNKTLTSPVLDGTVSGTAVATAGTASKLALRDSNGILTANAYNTGFTTQATSGGVTAITAASTGIQIFTGTSAHTVTLPTISIVAGSQYIIANQSTGRVLVQSFGFNAVTYLPTGGSGIFTALTGTPTTAAHWKVQYMGPARIDSVASSATPSINTDLVDEFDITAQAAAITSMTTNLTGAPVNGQRLMIRIKDDGTARAITWGASFQSSGVATLLATTVATKTHYVGLIYNSTTAKWICMAVDATGY